MPKTVSLSVDVLRIDAGTQVRVKTSDDTVGEYAELMSDSTGWPFGPVDVFHDGTDYFVADGFHRVLAANRVGRASVPCTVHRGTAHDAKIFGMTANDRHGLRMTREDKKHCVKWLLTNGGKMTQAEIAEKAGVSVRTVKGIVAELRELEKPNTLPSTEQQSSVQDTVKGQIAPFICPDDDSSEVDDVPFDIPDAPEAPVEAPANTSNASIVLDVLGRPIPPKFRPANELGIVLMSTGRELDKYRKKAKEFTEQPGGDWLRLQDIDDQVRSLKAQFQDARYHTVCPSCDGAGGKCKQCDGAGWLPDYRKGTIN